MKRLSLMTLLCACFLRTWTCMADVPQDVNWASYHEVVDLQPDGSARVEVAVTPASGDQQEILIPVTLGAPVEARLLAPAPVALEREKIGGTSIVRVTRSENVDLSGEVRLSYVASGAFSPETARRSDYGNVEVKYQFVHLNPAMIASFSAEILLPEGVQLKAVDEFSPKPKKGDPNEPYRLGLASGGRKVLTISLDRLAFGQRVSMKWRQYYKDGQRGLLIGLLLVALAYLISFRDLVVGPEA